MPLITPPPKDSKSRPGSGSAVNMGVRKRCEVCGNVFTTKGSWLKHCFQGCEKQRKEKGK